MGFLANSLDAFRLEPIFGPKAWGANSTCDDVHPHGPIPHGSKDCCMSCHASGRDSDRVMKITAKDEDRLVAKHAELDASKDPWSPPPRNMNVEFVAGPDPNRQPELPSTRKERRRIRARTLSPEAIARLVDSGRATTAFGEH